MMSAFNTFESSINRRIFVSGLPPSKTKKDIWRELGRVGMVGIVDVIVYRSYGNPNLNRGFAFVEFASHELAATARKDCRALCLFGNKVYVNWSTPLHEVDEETMKRVKRLFLRNLPVADLDRFGLTKLLLDVLGPNTLLDKVFKFRDYAFVHFRRRKDAVRGLSLLQQYYSGTAVEVMWSKPPPNDLNDSASYHSSDSGFSQMDIDTDTDEYIFEGQVLDNLVRFFTHNKMSINELSQII